MDDQLLSMWVPGHNEFADAGITLVAGKQLNSWELYGTVGNDGRRNQLFGDQK